MEIKILLNKAWEEAKEGTVHTEQKLQINDNSIFLTLITNTLDVESIYEQELFFDDFEVNKIYTVYYGRNGYYPFILDSNYEMSSEDNALRFYITQDRKIVEIYCDVFTKVIDEDKYDVKYAKCENENSLWKFRHYIKFKYSKYNTNESSMSEALTLILNPNKSLSYIDAQLDIITRMLIELVELNRDKISKESLKLFDCVKDTLNNTSLLNIMSEEKLLNKFKYKEYTRSIQTKQREILKNEQKETE